MIQRSCKRFRGYTQKRGGICLRICINQQNPFTLCCKRRRQMHCRCGFPCSSFLVCNCNNFGHIDSVSCVKTLAIKKESDRVTEVTLNAGVAELADAQDSKSCDRKVVWVRPPPPAPILRKRLHEPCFIYKRTVWSPPHTQVLANALTLSKIGNADRPIGYKWIQ